jgi:hypothetical protein
MAFSRLLRATFCKVGMFFLAANTMFSSEFVQIGQANLVSVVIVAHSYRLHGSL